ncbi:Uncharacterised protein [Serratia quinivorans]|nr:Uncharacterised protein [Serratia quinivorans]CAI1025097.1 Uncharacterised protein [Serratia quinivorans]CAI2151174.1 Uncharacterised protein [Serratia quinivorans]
MVFAKGKEFYGKDGFCQAVTLPEMKKKKGR